MLYRNVDDITIRELLNIKQYIKIPFHKNISYDKKIKYDSFFFIDNNICIGFKINTIDGDIIIPVIGMKHIRIKRKIKYDLEIYHQKIIKKRKLNNYLILFHYTTLPFEIINKIMSYY